MSKEIYVRFWCDNPAHPPRTAEADTITVWLEQREERVEVEVCDDCLKTLAYAEVMDLAEQFGRAPTPPEEDPMLVCPHVECPRHTKPFKDSAGRQRHLTRVHNEPAEESVA